MRQSNPRHARRPPHGKCCNPPCGGTPPRAEAAIPHKKPGSAPPAGGTAAGTPVQTAAWKRPFCLGSIPFYCTTAGGVCHKKAKKKPAGWAGGFEMRAACALRISSGRIILNLQCWKLCGFSSIAFSQGGVAAGNGTSAKRRKKTPGSECSSGQQNFINYESYLHT